MNNIFTQDIKQLQRSQQVIEEIVNRQLKIIEDTRAEFARLNTQFERDWKIACDKLGIKSDEWHGLLPVKSLYLNYRRTNY